MSVRRTAVVVAAHGSRSEPGVERAVRALVVRLTQRGIADHVVAAFHLHHPGFDTVLDSIAAEQVAVVPLLTSDGYFHREVLPAALRRNACAERVSWRITAPVGTHGAWLDVLAADITHAAGSARLANHRVEVAVVAHGTTREKESQRAGATLAASLGDRLGVPASAFYLDAEPGLETLWSATTREHVIVVPFLLGGGHLRDDLPARMGTHPTRTATILGGLLDSGALDDIVAARAREGLRDVGTVTLVGAGPGDPGLITVRGLAALRAADVVIHDRLVAPELLLDVRADAVVVDAGKRPGDEAAAQERINALLVEHAHAGRSVVRLKGGDSFVFGRGSEETDTCSAHGIPVVVVPGVTSAIAVPAAAGIPVPERDVARSFAMVTARTAKGRAADHAALLGVAHADTIVVMMGASSIATTADDLMAAGRAGATPVSLVSRGTTPQQRVVNADLATVGRVAAAAAMEAPMVMVVGDVARRAVSS